MPFVYEAKCDRCDYRSEVLWPLWACYQWPVGTARAGGTLEIAQQWVWCNDCNSIRIGEALPDIEEIERLQAIPVIARAYDEGKKVWGRDETQAVLKYARYPRVKNLYDGLTFWKRWDIKKSIVLFQTLILHHEWRMARTSPARCLTCGGTDFVPLPTEFEGEPKPFNHTACGGWIGFHNTRKVNAYRLLWTIEGKSLGKG